MNGSNICRYQNALAELAAACAYIDELHIEFHLQGKASDSSRVL